MHFLARSIAACPPCLRQYRHGQNHWGDLTYDDKQEIRTALEALQGRRCAYCECDLDLHDQHIEHFHQRDRYPQGTFDWDNLFWSCGRDDSCGKNKDRCGQYNHADLIKPDVDNPEHFFLFSKKGTIIIRQNLTANEQNRASETLRILNLDAEWGPLRRMRQKAASGYVKTAEEIEELASLYPPQVWLPFLEDELAQIRHLPFCTTIKHVLTPQEIII